MNPGEAGAAGVLPSFDARDWAAAFCKIYSVIPEDEMIGWFASALMRGFDEATARSRIGAKGHPAHPRSRE